MRKRMTKKRRRPSSTSKDRLARRSWTSTSPSPTRADVVVVGIVDVVVAAVAKDVDEVAAGVVMEKGVPLTGSAVRARMVSAEHRGSQGNQGRRARKAEVVAVEKVVVAARVVDVAKDAEPVEAAESHVENSASTRRLSPPWGNEETREERSYDLLILYREHSSEEHKIKKILPQRFYVFLSIFYTTPKMNIDIQFP